MKKFFTLLVLALINLGVNAQNEPLFTFTTTLTNDAEWGDEYVSSFAFQGTKVNVEVYADDYIIIRDWAGAKGCDLKLEYDPTIDLNDDDCYGNILSAISIIDGVEQTPLTYEKTEDGYTFQYYDFSTGREDYPVVSSTLNEDGTLFWSFIEVDKETGTGYVELSYLYFLTSDYSEYMTEQFYYAAWPENVTPDGPVLMGTYKGEVIQYTDEDGNIDDTYGVSYLYGYDNVTVDVYDQYIYIHDWSNNPSDPRDLKVICANDDNATVTGITYICGVEETEITNGYIYTGYSAENGDDYLYNIYIYQSYCLGGWDEEGGYILIAGYPYTKNVETKKTTMGSWGYWLISWPQENDIDVINNIKKDNVSHEIYNLNGQRVSKDYRGVLLRDGKKYIR